jgi:hypothetical protein
MKNLIYEGNAYWVYDNEILDMDVSERYIGRHFSSVPPLSRHQGKIYLSDTSIRIDGDEEVNIPIADINHIHLGFDDVFSAASVKNFGMFWKPIRVNYGPDTNIYLIIDYSLMISNNNRFFEMMKALM